MIVQHPELVMQIGVGLPVMVPGTSPAQLLAWAVRAEESGFASLGVLDRLAYGNYDPLIALAAAAAVTSRIQLATTVLLGAARGPAAVLAKQTASLHRIAGDRLTLGLAAGGRRDDYTLTGAPYHRRGRDLDALIAALGDLWRGTAPAGTEEAGTEAAGAEAVGPPLAGGAPRLLIGGHSEAAMRRAALYADGWISGSGSAEPFADRLARLHRVWSGTGRTGRPHVTALAYFALGDGAPAAVERYLGDCYRGTGPYLRRVVAEALTTGEAVRRSVDAYDRAGCDEVILLPCASDPGHLAALARELADHLPETSAARPPRPARPAPLSRRNARPNGGVG